MKMCFISDTHNRHSRIDVPECDILFHSGDWTGQGTKSEVESFAKWLNKQTQAKHIVVIPGNHEKIFAKCIPGSEQDPSSLTWFKDNCSRAHLLIHESVEIEGLKIFGSPWTPYFHDWAWNAGRTITEAAHVFKPFIGDLWKDIPDDTQVLITHGPPHGILDYAKDWNNQHKLISVGCSELMKRICQLKELRMHAFGHIHLMGGKIKEENNVRFINAACCDESYQPNNKIVELDIYPELDWQYLRL